MVDQHFLIYDYDPESMTELKEQLGFCAVSKDDNFLKITFSGNDRSRVITILENNDLDFQEFKRAQ